MTDDMIDLLGRRVNHDPRSLAFPASVAPVIRTIHWPHYGPVLYQWVGSCTGHSMAQWLNFKPGHVPWTRYMDDNDAMEFYHRATQIDPWPGEYPPTDTGSSGLAVAKAAQERGDIKSYTHAFGLEHTLGALMTSPVLIGTNWYDDMFTPDAKGFVHPSGGVAGGHEYVLFGINLRDEYVWGQNHWENWTKGSRFKIRFDDLDLLLRNDGDVTVPIV